MTDNQKYSEAVEAGVFSGEMSVPIDLAFSDERGEIVNLLLSPITSVARIVSKAESVRANHYHKTDWHYAFVEKGEVLYFERAVGSTEVSEPKLFIRGEMFFTPPMREHAMLFPVNTVIYTFAKNVRTHEGHEADLVRVTYVTPEMVTKFIR